MNRAQRRLLAKMAGGAKGSDLLDAYVTSPQGRRDPAVARLNAAVDRLQQVMTDPDVLEVVAELREGS